MDERVSDFFGSENGHGSGSQGASGHAKSGNGFGVAQRKSFLKSKKSKTRFARNLKPSNNTPYLPPEVSEAGGRLVFFFVPAAFTFPQLVYIIVRCIYGCYRNDKKKKKDELSHNDASLV